MQSFSRRAVLQALGAAGLAAATPGGSLAQNRFARLDGEPWYFLTDAEARFLAAACDVLIPADDFPSASQAGVVDFIDLQMVAPYGHGATLYLEGPFPKGGPEQGWQMPYPPAEVFRRAIGALEEGGTRLADFDAPDREEAIRRLSEDELSVTDDISAKGFFDELLALTNEGYFADPIYGGNAGYAGWEMVGFPGAHAYYLDFVEANRPYRVKPRGIAHVPGTDRPAGFRTAEGR
jgi:gluconate 2-dehydrogenase alpha chain/gluconate 2-dehydrogenase gamma chain